MKGGWDMIIWGKRYWYWCDLSNDLKWTHVPGIQLLAQEPKAKVFCREPDPLSWSVSGIWPSVMVSLSLTLRMARWRCTWTVFHVSSLLCNQSLMAGSSEGSPDQGNRGGWKLSTHWKGLRPVDGLRREFCAYSAHRRKRLQSFWLWWQ